MCASSRGLPRRTLIPALLALVSGFAVDVLAVLWTRAVTRHQVGKAACWSMLLGTAQVLGIGAAVRDIWLAPFFVIGYGAGSFVALWISKE